MSNTVPTAKEEMANNVHESAVATTTTTSNAAELPLISVIVPVYNTGAYLIDAVKSVVAQTYPNLELILVDDASSDELTLKLLAAYEQVDVLTPDNIDKITAQIELPSLATYGVLPKEIVAVHDALKQKVSMLPDAPTQVHIRVLHSATNQGAGEGRNIGVRASTGSYLLFMDADDLFAPQLIEHAYKTKLRTSAEVVLFANHNFSYDPDYDLREQSASWNIEANKLLPCVDIIKQQLFNVGYTVWGCLLSRQTFIDKDLFLAPHVIFEDNDWVVRMVLRTDSLYYTPFDGYWRLMHASQLTAVDYRGARVVNLGDMLQRMVTDIKASPYYAQARNSCIESALDLFGYWAQKLKADTPNKKQVLQELFSRISVALAMLGAAVSCNPSWFYMQWHHIGYKLPWLSAASRSNHHAAYRMARLYLRYCK